MFCTRPFLGAVLFALINLMLGSLHAQQVIFKVDQFTTTFTRPEGASSTANSAWYVNGTRVATQNTFSSGGPGPGTRTYTHGAAQRGGLPSDAVRLVINVIVSGQEVPVFWKQAYIDGTPPNSPSGPYTGGEPTTPGGEPVDPWGVPKPPDPKVYKCEAQWLNSHKVPATVLWTVVVGTESVESGQKEVQPGSVWQMKRVKDKPFRIVYEVQIDFAPTGEGGDVPAEELPPEDPTEPDPEPDPGTPGTGTPGVGTTPGQQQVPTPDPVTPEPRPGEGDPNDEARHKEAMAQMNRIVGQIANAANQAAADADITNGYLSDIKNNTKGGGDGGDGEGNGDADTANLEAIKGSLTGGSGSVGTFEPGDSATGQGITAATGNLVTAVGNFGSALALGAPGSQQLQWSIEVPEVGSRQINLEPYASSFTAVRTIILMVAGYIFWQAMVKTIRGAFADG